MEVSQTPPSKELISYTETKRKSKEYWKQYNQKRLAYIVAKNKERRIFLKTNQPPKPLSSFQRNKQNLLLKLLINPRSFVPVPTKLKHPIIKNWNAPNYWYPKKLDLNNLERGCVRIYEDNWNKCFIGWLDIDCKKWTKRKTKQLVSKYDKYQQRGISEDKEFKRIRLRTLWLRTLEYS